MPPDLPIACNPLCARCRRPCKQAAAVILVECPRYAPFPFKVERHRFEQLELFGGEVTGDG